MLCILYILNYISVLTFSASTLTLHTDVTKRDISTYIYTPLLIFVRIDSYRIFVLETYYFLFLLSATLLLARSSSCKCNLNILNLSCKVFINFNFLLRIESNL